VTIDTLFTNEAARTKEEALAQELNAHSGEIKKCA
jgi:hypothetical protein